MKFFEQKIPGLFRIEPEPFVDKRGAFRRHFCQREFAEHGISVDIRQCNIGENRARHTLRGFHYLRSPHLEGKVVSCIRGSLHDVVVDLRSNSSTYLQWVGVDLTEENGASFY